ncbi:hypothetical protein MTO96_033662 [Rhipicephalus appendiculatus]
MTKYVWFWLTEHMQLRRAIGSILTGWRKKIHRNGTPASPVTKLLRHVTPSFRSISWAGRRPSSTPRVERLDQLVTACSLDIRMAEIVCCRPTGHWVRTVVRIWRMRSERTYQILTISPRFEPTASQGMIECFETHSHNPG